jgi:hypothetical protein
MSVKTERKSPTVVQWRRDDLQAKFKDACKKASDDLAASFVCRGIVDDFVGTYAKRYYIDFEEGAATDSWNDPGPSLAERWQDYVRGAALTLDPLPECPFTFETSDLEAVYSDWLAVDADLSKAWHTLELARKTLEDFSDVEHRKWTNTADAIEQDRINNAAGPSSDHSATNRDHSSWS